MELHRKSRGSFVDHRRKSLTLTNIFSDGSQEKPEIKKPEHSMKSYMDSLTKEKQEWKELLRVKKIQRKDQENQYKLMPLTVTKSEVEKFISESDAEFLSSRPDYLGMVLAVKKYIDAINYLNKYKSDVIDYYDNVCNELEIDKQLLVEEMCAADLCEICNIKNCQRQDHKFTM